MYRQYEVLRQLIHKTVTQLSQSNEVSIQIHTRAGYKVGFKIEMSDAQ